MNWVGEDGVSKRFHLEKAASGLIPNLNAVKALADEPTLPALAHDVWVHFLMLHKRRGRDMDGPLRFTWAEISAYCAMTGTRFDSWQLRNIFLLEDEYFAVRADNTGKNKTTKPRDKSKGSKEVR